MNKKRLKLVLYIFVPIMFSAVGLTILYFSLGRYFSMLANAFATF